MGARTAEVVGPCARIGDIAGQRVAFGLIVGLRWALESPQLPTADQ